MNSAEASVLAWFVGADTPIGFDDFDTNKLIQALMVIWPEYMGKMHAASLAVIDNKRRQMKDPEFANRQAKREYDFETVAYRRSMARIRKSLKEMPRGDAQSVKNRISEIVKRERYYSNLRMSALIKRLNDSIDYERLRSEDPRSDYSGGALWVLDPSKDTHTADCLLMEGKVWSWRVLRVVNPANRHFGCGCRLKQDPSLTYGIEAQTNAPIGIIPTGVDPSWDMGELSARPMIDVKYQVPSFNDFYRSL